jgi:phage terminase large subunit-like protein
VGLTLKQKMDKSDGDILLESIRDEFINKLGVQWSEIQIKIFDAFLKSCLPLIYKDEPILAATSETLVLTSRRVGKTYIASAIAAVLLLKLINVSVTVFSSSTRSTQLLAAQIIDVIKKVYPETICEVQPDTNYIIINGTQKLHYDATGFSDSNVIILDEMSHMDSAIFYKEIVPNLQLKKTILLALTTPSSEPDNYVNQLVALKNETTGAPFFNTFVIN